MPRVTPEKQFAHALNQLGAAIRLARAAEQALRAALRARPAGPAGRKPRGTQEALGGGEAALAERVKQDYLRQCRREW